MKFPFKVLMSVLFCLILMSSAFAAENKTETILSNGMKVFIKPMRAMPVVTVSLWVKNGSAYESDVESGFSELVSRAIFTSSVNFPGQGLKSEISRLRLKFNRKSANDCQSFSLTGGSKNFETMVELGIDGLFNSVITDEDSKLAFQNLKKDVAELESDPDVVVFNAMMQKAFTQHPCRRPFYGLNQNYKEVNPFSLNRYYKKFYTPANSVLVVTGDVEPSKALSIIRKYAEQIKPSSFSEPVLPTEPKQSEYREIFKYADLQKVYVNFGWKVPNLKSPDSFPLYVIAKILGGSEESILWKKLVNGRETCEFVKASYAASRLESLLTLSAVTSKTKLRYFINDVKKIIRSLLDDPLSIDIIEEAKMSIITEDIFSFEGVEEAALNYGSFAITSEATDADDFANRISSVNLDDIRRVVGEYLREENLTVAVLQSAPNGDDAAPVMQTLSNGVKLITKENHSSPVMAVSCKFLAGGLREEKRNAGISLLAAEMLYNSTDTDGKTFISKLEKLGARLSYKACKNYVSVDMKVISSSFIPAFDLLTKMLNKAEFPTAYAKIRKIFEDRLEAESRDSVLVNEHSMLRTLFPNSPINYSDAGKIEDITKIRRQDVIDFYKRYFTASNMVIAVVGNFYASELNDYLLDSLGRISSGGRPKEIKTSEMEYINGEVPLFFKNDIEEAQISYISKTIPVNDERFLPLTIACRILEDSLKKSFRKADNSGLMANTVEIRNNSFLTEGFFKAAVSTSRENVATAAQLLLLEIDAFKITPPPHSKLLSAKSSIYNEFAVRMSDNLSLADTFSRDEVLGLGFDYYSKFDTLLSSISANDVKEVANNFMLSTKGFIIGVSASNTADLVFEDRRLTFKQPKEEKVEDKKEDKK